MKVIEVRGDSNIDSKKEKDSEAGFNRPELDGEYEDEFLEKDMLVSISPLKVNGSDQIGGRIVYCLKLCKDNDPKKKEIQYKYDKFIEDIKVMSKKNEYICRVYIYNSSNLTPNDESTELAYVWIKRYETDEENKDNSSPFSIISGEVNKCYNVNLIWPFTFNLKIQIYGISGFMKTHSLIGETNIDLEKRLFNKAYQEKLEQ